MSVTGSSTWSTLSIALLLAGLALSSYILWRRYRSRRLLVQRISELEELSAAGRAIVAAELDMSALCALIAQEAGKVIDNQTFQIGLFDGNVYEVLFWTINGRQQPTPRTFDLTEGAGIVGWIRESKQALLVKDFQREMDSLPARPRSISDTPSRSAIFIPLISGEQVLGVITAQSQQPNHFDEEDLRRLMILANQAAAAVANARLFAQVQMRAAHLELVRKIARQVNAVQDLEEIFSQVVTLTQQMFGFHAVHIFGVNPLSGEIEIQASSDPQAPLDLRLLPGQGLVGTAVATRQTILANDTRKDSRYTAAGQEDLTRAEIAIPLLVNDSVVGVLDVHSHHIGTFTAPDQTMLEALAAEIANAIHKAREFARQQERAWLTTAQLQVAAALSSSEDLETMGEAITRLTAMLLGSHLCALLLWQEETEVYRCAALYAANGRQSELRHRQFSLGDWPSLDAVHVGQEAIATRQLHPAVLACLPRKGLHTLHLVPIATKTQMLGVLVAEAAKGLPPNQQVRQAELLRNIAQQLARALENAYLRLALQEEAWVNTVLLQVAEAVNSRIELDEILNTIVRLIPMLVGVESVVILVWDEVARQFKVGSSYGISNMALGLLETLELAPDEVPDFGEIGSNEFEELEAIQPRSSAYTLHSRPWLQKVLGTPHAHLTPLHARRRLVGLLLVGTQDRTLSTRRLNILTGIAHQAATAVVNNQLYQEAAERERLAEELRVAHQIQASLMPRGNPQIPGCSVASFWQAARSVSGDFYDFIPLRSGHWGIVVADVADKGVPAALFMALTRTILRTIALNRSDPAEVLMRVNEIIDSEAQSDLFVTVFYGVWQPETKTLVYANGGHNPPMLLRADGRTELLNNSGIALGVLPGITIHSRRIHLERGDTLLLYTDGVTEAVNEDYDEFGMERMRLAALSVPEGDASAIVQAITDAIRSHAGNTPQFDDITLVVLKRSDS